MTKAHLIEKLLLFLFLAIMLAFAYHFAFAELYAHYFSTVRAFQTFWYVPFIIVPALLQLGLAVSLGFWRKGHSGWADITVLIVIAIIVYLNLDASYSCGTGCF
jgi:hypothetical protein